MKIYFINVFIPLKVGFWHASIKFLKMTAVALSLSSLAFSAMASSDDGVTLDKTLYVNRQTSPDFTAAACPDNPRGLVQIKGDLYRHTTGPGLAVHSGFVLITKEGALIIDPAMTCTSEWLRNEIKKRFNVPVKYVVYTHAHADHISGGQIFQKNGAIVVANQRAVEPIVGEKIPTALPDKVFDQDMTIVLGGETVKLHRVAPSHSNSMVMVYFPKYKALQCTDVCESKSMPYNDFLDFYYDGWVDTLDWVLKQDVDVIDVGHYSPASKSDIIAERDYLIDLHDQVLNLVRSGQSWDELYRNVKFSPEVQKWTGFSSMKTLNILGMYRWVSNHRRGEW
ncbi:MBL fold metallo-hydrolase [Serratia marcescens]|nr:MBL fold metallo-hydrolase [Serratia marcescens]